MATVTEDLVAGHRLLDIRGGSSIVRTFIVSGLVGAPHAQLLEAIRDPGVPKVGDQYPNSEPLFVNRVNAEPDGPNKARIECEYAVPNRPSGGSWNQPLPIGDGRDVKAFTAGLREVTTTRDRQNNAMTLNPPAKKTLSEPYLSEARTFKPVGSLSFERVESVPPSVRVRDQVGTVNSGTVGIYAQNTLLFRSLEAISEDGGRSWNCTYTFDFSSDGWQHVDTWKDEQGRTPSDATESTFDVLPTSNFAALSLDFTAGQVPL